MITKFQLVPTKHFFRVYIKQYSHFQGVTSKQEQTHFQNSYQTLMTLSSYFQTILHTLPHINQYLHFERVTGKQYYTLFQSSYQTILITSESYWQTIVHTFPQLTSNKTDIFRELLANNTTYFSRVYTKQYCHFWRVPSKLNYSKNFFHGSYHTIMTLLENYYQTILAYSELISNSIHTFTEFLANNSENLFESFNEQLNRQNSQTENSKATVRRISIPTRNRHVCCQLSLSLHNSLHNWSMMALWKKMIQPSLPKGNQVLPIQKVPKKLKFSKQLATQHQKLFSPHKNNIFFLTLGGKYILWK